MNLKKISIAGLSVMILSLMLSLSPFVLAQDTNDESSSEDIQSSSSSSNISKIWKSDLIVENTEVTTEESTEEVASDNMEVNGSNKENFTDDEKLSDTEEGQGFIGPIIRAKKYGDLSNLQRLYSGRATFLFQYADKERVRGLKMDGVFNVGSTMNADDIEGKQMYSWNTDIKSRVTFKLEDKNDNGIQYVDFPGVTLARPNVVIPEDGQSAGADDILAYGEIAKLNQLVIMNVPNDDYVIIGSDLIYRVETIADYRYDPSKYFYQSSVYTGSANDLSFVWQSGSNKYISTLAGVAKIKMPWQLYHSSGGVSTAYFPVWATGIRNIPKKEYPLEEAPRASMAVTYGTQEGEVIVTLQNSNFIERYVNRNGDNIAPPNGKIQANKIPAIAGTTYTGDFPEDYENGNLTYRYNGWHSTFYKSIAEIPGGLKSGNPSMKVVNQGGKPINGVYNLTAKVSEEYVDDTGASLNKGSFDQKSYFDNYSSNPKFNGNPDQKKSVGSDRYLYKGYLLDDENMNDLKEGIPSINVSQNRKIKYVYERIQPTFELKTIPTGISVNGVLKEGKVTIPSSSSGSNQISVTNTLGTNSGWNLYAELEWQSGELGSASRIVTTSSGSVQETDLFGTTVTVPTGVIDTEHNLKIGTIPSLVMLGNSGVQSYEGTYTTDLGTFSLEIDDGSKVSARSYSGNINWNLANVP